MGVLGLAPFLQKVCPDVFKILPNRFRELTGKTIVFDGTLVTQRFHFAPMPHPYRHVLGWYRMIQELKSSDVTSICVFDGRARSQAKQIEVERRREARKVVAARNAFEADRLRRLRKLAMVVRSWRHLEPLAKQTATATLRALIHDSALPSYSAGDLDLTQACSSQVAIPTSHAWEQEAYDATYGEFRQEDLSELLKRTGVPVSASGELEPDIIETPGVLQSRVPPSKPHPSPTGDFPISDHFTSDGLDVSQLGEMLNLTQEAWQDMARSSRLSNQSVSRIDVNSAITSLYDEYRRSTTHLESLPKTPAVSSAEVSSDPAEARVEYAMSKSQHQLAEEEGAFWSTLAQSELSEDIEKAADTLAEKSTILSESYERRTHPPTPQTYEECKEIIRAMGIPCIETDGPYEAEALASAMVLNGQADYVASEDTDVLVYGAPLVRNASKRTDPLVIISGKDIREALNLDQDRFIDFALLLGTDFSQRIKNVGPQRALKFVREYGTIEQVVERETQYPPRTAPASYIQQVQLARLVFHTLPPIPEPADLQAPRPDEAAVQDLIHRYGLGQELSQDYDWDHTRALSGNYFNDNPSAL